MAGSTVEIVEVSPRDGLQNESIFIETADKLRLIGAATAAGIRRLEVTSFVNPRRVPQMRDADAIFATLANNNAARHIGLVLNAKGFERAVAIGCREINYVVVASETFNQRNQGASIAETLAQWREIAVMARAANIRTTVSVAASFGCPFEGEVPLAAVLKVMEQVLVTPPDEIAFADTIGCGVPGQVRALLGAARRIAPDLKQRCHFHDTRNTGIANALAAVESGVDALDSSIGGLGGCPFAPAATGNIATEDLVYMMDRMGVQTGVALEPVMATAHWISGLLGKPVVSALSRAGGFPAKAPTGAQ